MSIDIRYTMDRDPDAGYLTYYISYAIPAYIDPESYEYFGDTQWSVTYSHASDANPPALTGTGSESGDVYLELYLDGSTSVVNYRLSFTAWNTFMPSLTETLVWNVLSAAYATAPQIVNGSSGVDFFIGGLSNDLFNALEGNDHVDAGAGDDDIYGGAGSDYIDGGIGNDEMFGGADGDTYVVDSVDDKVIEGSEGGHDHVISSVGWTLAADVEDLTLTGYGTIDGAGNTADNQITGNGSRNALIGYDGNDRLIGGFGDDTLIGGRGNDVLVGDGGGDSMDGGAGDDTYFVDSLSDRIIEAEGGGLDTVYAIVVRALRLGANVENLTFSGLDAFHGIGNAGNNVMASGAGNDALEGGAGNDALSGAQGNDLLVGGAGGDGLNGGDGIDTASYTASALGVVVNLVTGKATGGDAAGDILSGIENLIGGAGSDQFTGTAVANYFKGGDGNDILSAGSGNDLLFGGRGADTLFGDEGIDIISYAGASGAVVINLATQTASGGDAQGDRLRGIERVIAGEGADVITGSMVANVLVGNGGIDTIAGGDGNDLIRGGSGGDFLDGGNGFDVLSYAGSRAGGVTIDLSRNFAGSGDAAGDILVGFESAEGSELGDTLAGTHLANRLSGRGGADTLDGGRGNDTLSGGADGDRFVFAVNYGQDRITDFNALQGDVIALRLGTAFDTYEEVIAVASTFGPSLNDTIFRFSATETLVLQGVSPWIIGSDSFAFAWGAQHML